MKKMLQVIIRDQECHFQLTLCKSCKFFKIPNPGQACLLSEINLTKVAKDIILVLGVCSYGVKT